MTSEGRRFLPRSGLLYTWMIVNRCCYFVAQCGEIIWEHLTLRGLRQNLGWGYADDWGGGGLFFSAAGAIVCAFVVGVGLASTLMMLPTELLFFLP